MPIGKRSEGVPEEEVLAAYEWIKSESAVEHKRNPATPSTTVFVQTVSSPWLGSFLWSPSGERRGLYRGKRKLNIFFVVFQLGLCFVVNRDTRDNTSSAKETLTTKVAGETAVAEQRN